MSRHVALLRGINVGGRATIAMADLRAAVRSLGYQDVSTYIQTGNVLFTAGGGTASLAEQVRAVIARTFGLTVGVVVVRADELATAASGNPYAAEPDPKRVHIVFLSGDADPALRERLSATATASGGTDELTVSGRVIYLHTPGGYGTSELARAVLRLTTPVQGTARNLATVTRLRELLGS